MKRALVIILVIVIHLIVFKHLWNSGENAENDKKNENQAEQVQPDNADSQSQTDGQDGQVRRKPEKQPGRWLKNYDFNSVGTKLPDEIATLAKTCRAGLLLNLDEHKVLWRKNEDTPLPIASLTKMMTALLVAEQVKNNPKISYQTKVKVTRNASGIGGSQVWLDPRETFTVDELLKCVMIHSANDAAFMLAQFFGRGDVDNFIEQMNQAAKELGLEHARFFNPHGLDGDNKRKTNQAAAREVACLAARLLDFPNVVKWSSTWLDYIRENDPRFDKFMLVNRNELIKSVPGMNGMKTGFTDGAGWCIAATCERDGRRVVCVLLGMNSKNERNKLTETLIDWAFMQSSN